VAELKSYACKKFILRINHEIAAGEYMHDSALKTALQSQKITPEGKRAIGIDQSVELTMFDVTILAYTVLPEMRFIYLSTLLEAFFEEYISERESISPEQVKTAISSEISEWDKNGGGSKSFYNLPFVFFVLSRKYSIDPTNSLNSITLESGILRNCIVHDSGKIKSQYYVNQLINTITFLGVKSAVGEILRVNKKLMALYIEEYRKIITC